MTPPQTTDGACLCEQVRFRVTLPVKWVAHCHCSMCRRAHGAGFVTWIGVEKAAFALLSSSTLVRYASSETASREFCGACGSPLFFRGERWPDEVHVARAAISDDVGMQPLLHAFFSDKADWVHVDDALPRRGGPTGTEPLT